MSKGKIALGMSGGVDSCAAALLLKQEGWSVTGITLILAPNDDGSAARDAMLAARQIGIEHVVREAKAQFEEKVIDYFAREYCSGFTPNPCVRCNCEIKFGLMLELARSMGIDKIATGHYARIEEREGRYLLRRNDSAKDQSYFLSMLNQQQLSSAVFPLAQHTKDEMRRITAESGLDCATKPDSQEVCFVEDNDYASFIGRHVKKVPEKGSFVDKYGNVLGEHAGIINYTVGQRKGLGAFGKPMFVTALDAKSNTVVLGEDGEQYSRSFLAGDINLIYGSLPDEFSSQVKIRYRAHPAAARVKLLDDGKAVVTLDEPQRSVTPGQTVAFYDGDYVMGGARIEKIISEEQK